MFWSALLLLSTPTFRVGHSNNHDEKTASPLHRLMPEGAKPSFF
jgi:hypothetical protein